MFRLKAYNYCQAAFTLMEAVFALMLFSFVLMGCLALESKSTHILNQSTIDYNKAYEAIVFSEDDFENIDCSQAVNAENKIVLKCTKTTSSGEAAYKYYLVN